MTNADDAAVKKQFEQAREAYLAQREADKKAGVERERAKSRPGK